MPLQCGGNGVDSMVAKGSLCHCGSAILKLDSADVAAGQVDGQLDGRLIPYQARVSEMRPLRKALH
jgi:hypothetical protein